MDSVTILSFLAAAIVLTVMPGPDNMFVLSQSILKGKYAGIFTSLGLCTGLLVHISAATIGISALVYQSAIAFSIVKYIGAAYLLYLAYKAFRASPTSFQLRRETNLHYKSLYKRGVIMNVLNPKVSLFFLALLPQFVNENAGQVSLQMLVLGVIFLIQALILFTLLSYFAEKVGQFLQKSARISKRLHWIEGSILAFIGIHIAFSEK